MTTIREQAILGLIARLETISGVTVHRNLRSQPDQVPALVVFDGSQQTDADQVGVKVHRMLVTVEGYIEKIGETAEEDWGAAVNALYGQVVDAIEADNSLGGSAIDCKEVSMTPDQETALQTDQATGWFGVVFEVTYQTAQKSASAFI